MWLGLKFLYAFVIALLFAHVALCGGGFLLRVLRGIVGLVVYLYVDSADVERRVAYRAALFVTLFGAIGAFFGDAKFDSGLLGRFVGWFVGFVLGLFGRFGATLRVPIIVAACREPNWVFQVNIESGERLDILVAHAAAIIFNFFSTSRHDEVFCVVPPKRQYLNDRFKRGVKCKGGVDRAFTDPSAAYVQHGWASNSGLRGNDDENVEARRLINEGFCNRDGLREKVEKHLQEHIELYEKERKARQPTLGALWLFRWAVKVDSWRERKASWRVVVAELWDELWDG